MPRSRHGGRHELGQNFLVHQPSIQAIVDLVAATDGPILELGAGDGALTRPLAATGRALSAIDIDEHRVDRLRRRLPGVDLVHADALRHPLTAPVVVGNIPFHLTTPILRRLLDGRGWTHAIVVTQWEVARKRAGVGGATLMTAQHAPWFVFELRGRIPRSGFVPSPSVDGGILAITRRRRPLLPESERRAFQVFAGAVFAGRGVGLSRIVQAAARVRRPVAEAAVGRARARGALPRDLTAEQWAAMWRALRG
jgi:23S rRNA (adenine-N6)-dimethyltransferase